MLPTSRVSASIWSSDPARRWQKGRLLAHLEGLNENASISFSDCLAPLRLARLSVPIGQDPSKGAL